MRLASNRFNYEIMIVALIVVVLFANQQPGLPFLRVLRLVAGLIIFPVLGMLIYKATGFSDTQPLLVAPISLLLGTAFTTITLIGLNYFANVKVTTMSVCMSMLVLAFIAGAIRFLKEGSHSSTHAFRR